MSYDIDAWLEAAYEDRSEAEFEADFDDNYLDDDDAYADADADHAPALESAFNDATPDNCSACGLAVVPDGSRHGYLTGE